MIIMRIPQQVSERVKEAPAQALRAVFSGIGQVLLVADRIKSRAAEPARAQPATEPASRRVPAAPKDESRWRSLDETGNVRVLSHQDAPQPEGPAAPTASADSAAAGDSAATVGPIATSDPTATVMDPVATPDPATTPDSATMPDSATAAEPAATAETAAGRDQAGLPVPNYDDLSIASLRARLRNLDSGQVRTLLDYEKANAGRAAVLSMFENRIAKLANEGA
jgi:hypothetical protein